MTDFRRFPKVRDSQSWDREARVVLNNALAGKMNVGQEKTLTASSATTTLSDPLITTASVISLMPMTANAVAALAGLYFDAPTTGQVVMHHANNAQVDKTFRYTVLG